MPTPISPMNTRLCQSGVDASKVANPSAPSAVSPAPASTVVRNSSRRDDDHPGHVDRDQQPEQQRVDQQPGVGRRDVAHLLEVAREQQRGGEQRERRRRARDQDRGDPAVLEELQRDDRRDGATLDGDEHRDHGQAGDDQGDHPLAEPDEQQPDAERQQRDAGQVQRRALALALAHRRGQDGEHDRQRGEPDRQVDGEHGLPADVVGEEAAGQRAGDEGHAHQPGQSPLQRRVAAAAEEVGDEDERQAFQRARARAPAAPR